MLPLNDNTGPSNLQNDGVGEASDRKAIGGGSESDLVQVYGEKPAVL